MGWFDPMMQNYSQGVFGTPNLNEQSLMGVLARGLGNNLINTGGNPMAALTSPVAAPIVDLLKLAFTPGAFGNAPKPSNPVANPAARPVAPTATPAAPSNSNVIFSLPQGASGGFMGMLDKVEGRGKNPRSSAKGYGQFIDGTWDQFIKENYPQLMQPGQVFDKPGAAPGRENWDTPELRAKLGPQAVSWYANKNAQALGATGQPVNDWSLRLAHFLDGPVAAKVMSADPKTPISQLVSAAAIKANPEVLGGNKTAGDVVLWAQKQMPGAANVPYPPTAGAGTIPMPPEMGTPPQMQAGGLPNFDQTNQFLDSARPKPLNEAELQKMTLMNSLGGLSTGASKFAPEAGSTGRILAAAGGGGATALGESTKDTINMRQKQDQRESEYNLIRAQASTSQMQQTQLAEERQRQIAFQNSKSIYDTNVANAENAYKATVANKLAELKAQSTNDERHYEWLNKVQEFAKPKVLKADEKGITVQAYNPDKDSIDIQHYPTNDLNAQMEVMGRMEKLAPGSPATKFLKYNLLFQTTGAKDPLFAQLFGGKMLFRDAIDAGLGKSVFGGEYEKAVKEATDQINKESPMLVGKEPERHQAIVMERVSNMLLQRATQAGQFDQIAAAMAKSGVLPQAALFLRQ